MSQHEFITHKTCDGRSCAICAGGLAICAKCGCIEGSLPTECPGIESYSNYGDAIHKGEIDFVNGNWQRGVSKYSPARYR